jgi:cell wall-associated NlpC family hydrolase
MGEGGAPDCRLTPARSDLAAEKLRGTIDAPRYVEPRRMRVAVAVAPLTRVPDAEAPLDTQLLLGEAFDVYDVQPGWVWGQAAGDGYVGFIPDAALGPDTDPPTHRVTLPMALIYPEADLKTRPIGTAPLGGALRVASIGAQFCELAEGGFIPTRHLCPIDSPARDWVAVAHMFLGVPYLWGGRSAAGIDCSALVQLSRQVAGIACLRDSDMQQAAPGEDVPEGTLRRGDLVFWKGHVGIMLSSQQMLHANAHHMAVAIEPLERAARRIEANGGGPITARRRWPEAA